MFTTIDRYIMRSFFGGFFVLLGVGIGMYILLDLLFNLDEFTRDGTLPIETSLRAIFDYYRYNLPIYIGQIAAPAMAISAGFTLGMMMRNNELTPLVAAGVPLQRLAIPLALCAIVLLPLIVANREIIIPMVASKVVRDRPDTVAGNTQPARCVRDERGAVLTARELDVAAGRAAAVYFIEPAAEDGSVGVIQADAAIWDDRAEIWELERGARIQIGGGGEGARTAVVADATSRLPFRLSPEELLLRQSSEWSDLLSTQQLKELAKSRDLPNHSSILQSLILRFTEPLSHLILLALALPFFLTREKKNVIACAGQALLCTGLFFAFNFVSRELVTDIKSAQLAAGIPIIVFGPIALLLLLNAKT